MRITAIETFPLVYEMPYPLIYARGEYKTREALLVRVHTSILRSQGGARRPCGADLIP